MIPIKDNIAKRHPATVTWALIGANVLIFLFQISLPPPVEQGILLTYGLIPAEYFGELEQPDSPEIPWGYLPFVSNVFLHGGWVHLIFNMWMLWIFGPAVEDRLGHARFAVFYLLAGLAASLAHALFNMDSVIPVLGASGAIAGVIGCYVRMFPLARLVVVIPILFFPLFVKLPAILFAVFWLTMQLIPGIVHMMTPEQTGGIAWWAHIGGFAAGLLLMPLLIKRTHA